MHCMFIEPECAYGLVMAADRWDVHVCVFHLGVHQYTHADVQVSVPGERSPLMELLLFKWVSLNLESM